MKNFLNSTDLQNFISSQNKFTDKSLGNSFSYEGDLFEIDVVSTNSIVYTCEDIGIVIIFIIQEKEIKISFKNYM